MFNLFSTNSFKLSLNQSASVCLFICLTFLAFADSLFQNHGIVVYQTVIPDSISLPADIDIELYGDRSGS